MITEEELELRRKKFYEQFKKKDDNIFLVDLSQTESLTHKSEKLISPGRRPTLDSREGSSKEPDTDRRVGSLAFSFHKPNGKTEREGETWEQLQSQKELIDELQEGLKNS